MTPSILGVTLVMEFQCHKPKLCMYVDISSIFCLSQLPKPKRSGPLTCSLISKFAETLTGQRHATKNPQYWEDNNKKMTAG